MCEIAGRILRVRGGIGGWAVGFGLAAAAIAWGTRAAREDLERYLVMAPACALAFGLAAHLCVRDRSDRTRGMRRALAGSWALLCLAAVVSNVYLAAHPFAPEVYYSETITPAEGHPFALRHHGRGVSPFMLHLRWTLVIVGFIGGGITSIIFFRGLAPRYRTVMSVAAGTLLWTLAFRVFGYGAVAGAYLGRGAAIDLCEALSLPLPLGNIAGGFIGGAPAGLLIGVVAHYTQGLWCDRAARHQIGGNVGVMHRLFLAFVSVAIFTAAVGAQQKPDFTGQWVGVSPRENAGAEISVTQTATTLRTSHASEGDDHGFAYKLDGSESRNSLTSHGEAIVTVSKAIWNGSQLEITDATTYPDGRKSSKRHVWSLNEQGQLVVDVTMMRPGSEEIIKMTAVYRRK